jgi:hypothetical protein
VTCPPLGGVVLLCPDSVPSYSLCPVISVVVATVSCPTISVVPYQSVSCSCTTAIVLCSCHLPFPLRSRPTSHSMQPKVLKENSQPVVSVRFHSSSRHTHSFRCAHMQRQTLNHWWYGCAGLLPLFLFLVSSSPTTLIQGRGSKS